MSAATALAAGPEASPALAETAVRQALERAEADRADGVILLLSAAFLRHPHGAIVAAARAAGSLQVFGMVANGLMTEEGWSLDQPAVAALVLADGVALVPPGNGDGPRLAFTGSVTLPHAWESGPQRHGLLCDSAPVWQQGRLAAPFQGEASIAGATCTAALSTGLRRLGDPLPVEACRGYDLDRIGGSSAQESLRRALPPELREHSPLPIHVICAIPASGVPIPLLCANADGSITLAAPLAPGEPVAWAARQPLAAESDMRASLEAAAARCPAPAFALMFSCIGRGPLFYGDDDRDLLAFRRRFPGTPLLGAYGNGQIAPAAGGNRQFQNSVVTLLFETSHV